MEKSISDCMDDSLPPHDDIVTTVTSSPAKRSAKSSNVDNNKVVLHNMDVESTGRMSRKHQQITLSVPEVWAEYDENVVLISNEYDGASANTQKDQLYRFPADESTAHSATTSAAVISTTGKSPARCHHASGDWPRRSRRESGSSGGAAVVSASSTQQHIKSVNRSAKESKPMNSSGGEETGPSTNAASALIYTRLAPHHRSFTNAYCRLGGSKSSIRGGSQRMTQNKFPTFDSSTSSDRHHDRFEMKSGGSMLLSFRECEKSGRGVSSGGFHKSETGRRNQKVLSESYCYCLSNNFRPFLCSFRNWFLD